MALADASKVCSEQANSKLYIGHYKHKQVIQLCSDPYRQVVNEP